jgi:threonine-phosphate decarboxylase
MRDLNATLPIQHGGNQSAIRARLRLGNQALLDFSAPLNGLGPPRGAVAAVRRATESIDRYPEPGAPRLVERLAEFHQVPADRIIIGAGTTELICLLGMAVREQLLPHSPHNHLFHGNGNGNGNGNGRSNGETDAYLSHLVEPTYGEYRRTAAQNGLRNKVWDGHVLGWDQDFMPEGALGMVWTGHPNNPTGRTWDHERLREVIDQAHSGLTVVDEAYLPFLPDEAERTMVPSVVARDNLVVLRSMTKIYAIPGLRVGYAVASPEMVARLRRCQQPWSVTTAAELAALAALDDDEYLAETIDLIATESVRMTDRLWDVPGIRPAWPARERPPWAPPMANFVLVSLVDTPWTSPQVQDTLARRGLLVRECSNYSGLAPGGVVTGPGLSFETRGHLRICVRTRPENDLLLGTLEDVMRSEPEG